jgi:hypothetical protein
MSNSEYNSDYNSEYNSDYNSEFLKEYSPGTRSEILRERSIQRVNPYDNHPVDYPFHNLDSEMNIYKERIDFKMPESDQLLNSFYDHINYNYDKGRIDEHTYNYLMDVRELKNKIMYPSTAFQLTLQELIRLTNRINRDPNKIWMYYSDHSVKLIDFVVSVYLNYMRKDIRKDRKIYAIYNKEIILKYIDYLIKHGASIKNLDKIIPHEKLKQLYSTIYKMVFDKSRNKLKTLANYKSRHRKTKKQVRSNLGLSVVSKVLSKGKIDNYTAMKIKSYL